MTKTEKFAMLATMLDNISVGTPVVLTNEDTEMLKGFLRDEMTMVAKRNAYKSSKPTKAQVERSTLVNQVAEWVCNQSTVTNASVCAQFNISPQKAVQVVKDLVARGVIAQDRVEKRVKIYVPTPTVED